MNKYKHLPTPKVKIGSISNKGEMKIGFNQAMTVPGDHANFDYSDVFGFTMKSAKDDTLIEGTFLTYNDFIG